MKIVQPWQSSISSRPLVYIMSGLHFTKGSTSGREYLCPTEKSQCTYLLLPMCQTATTTSVRIGSDIDIILTSDIILHLTSLPHSNSTTLSLNYGTEIPRFLNFWRQIRLRTSFGGFSR